MTDKDIEKCESCGFSERRYKSGKILPRHKFGCDGRFEHEDFIRGNPK